MVKKLLFWSALAVGGLVLINTVKPGVISTWGKRIHAKLEKNLSPEFELARIKDQIKELTPDMHKNIGRIAEEMVAVDTLKTQVEDMQVRLNGQKEEIQAMTTVLEKGDKFFTYGGRQLTPNQIKAKLRNFREGEKALETKKKLLAHRQEGLESARQQLIETKQQKEKLELTVAEFETEIQALKLEQTRSKFQLDDSRLGEIKGALEDLRQRVEAERKKVELTGQFLGTETIREEKKGTTAEDVIAEVREAFAEKSDAAKK